MTNDGATSDDDGHAWAEPPFTFLDLRDQVNWEMLQDAYLQTRPFAKENAAWMRTPYSEQLPWRRCLAVLRSNEATFAFVEKRYIDRDYRSEYSAVYSQTLASIPDSTHRIHFFQNIDKSPDGIGKLSLDEILEDVDLQKLLNDSYLGYVVCRPHPLEIVGRTLIKPPPGISARTSITEKVNFFGVEFESSGVPFMQQDQRLGVCAHVAAWIILTSTHRFGDTRSLRVADIVRLAHGVADGRLGMSNDEAIALFHKAGLRPQVHHVDLDLPALRDYPWPEVKNYVPTPISSGSTDIGDIEAADLERRIAENVLPALNSGIPVYVAGASHAFVLCGYSALPGSKSKVDQVCYTLHDDQVGPYLQVTSPFEDYRLGRLAQVPRTMSREDCDKAVQALESPTSRLAKLSEQPAPTQTQSAEELEKRYRTLKTLYRQHYHPDHDFETDAEFEAKITDTVVDQDRRQWQAFILPMPNNVHLGFDAAERYALARFDVEMRRLLDEDEDVSLAFGSDDGAVEEALSLQSARSDNAFSVRTYVIKAADYKREVAGNIRDFPQDIALLYQAAQFPSNIVVVELMYRFEKFGIERNGRRDPMTVGEVILDATSGDIHPWEHAFRFGFHCETVASTGEVTKHEALFLPCQSGFPGARHLQGRSRG